jgi:lipoprotein-releasing system permease protein
LKLAFKIALRYFFSKKSTAAIQVLNWITVGAIAVGTAALIIVLSVFNGFEGLVISLYHSFNSDLEITPLHNKTFVLSEAQMKKIKSISELKSVSACIEENALLRFRDQQFIATLQGVDVNFEQTCDVSKCIYKGRFDISSDTIDLNNNTIQHNVVLGAGVAQSLGLNADFTTEPIQLYIPNRKSENITLDPMNAFRSERVYGVGSFAIQQDFDMKYVFVDYQLLKNLLQYDNEISLLRIALNNSNKETLARKQLMQILGNDVIIKNRYEQNELIYKIMKIEKWVVYSILSFILIIASFNMIGSLSMIAIDKRRDIGILRTFGADSKMVLHIFLLEGLIAAGFGALIGLVLGAIVCTAQIYFKIIKLGGNSFVVDAYPVTMQWFDFILVILTILLIGGITAWFPAQKASKQAMDLKMH